MIYTAKIIKLFYNLPTKEFIKNAEKEVIKASTKKELVQKILVNYTEWFEFPFIISIKIDFNNGKSRQLCDEVVKKIQYEVDNNV